MNNKDIILNKNIVAKTIENKELFWQEYITGSQIKNIINDPWAEYSYKLGLEKKLFPASALKRMIWGSLVEDKILELAKKPIAKFGFGLHIGDKLESGEEIITDKRTFIRTDIPFGANVDAFIVKNRKIKGIVEIKNTTVVNIDKLLERYILQILHYCFVFGAEYAYLVAKVPTDDVIGIKIVYENHKEMYEKWIHFLIEFSRAVEKEDPTIISDLNEEYLQDSNNSDEKKDLSEKEKLRIESLTKELALIDNEYKKISLAKKNITNELKLILESRVFAESYKEDNKIYSIKVLKYKRLSVDNEARIIDICKKANINADLFLDDKYKKHSSYAVIKTNIKEDKKENNE